MKILATSLLPGLLWVSLALGQGTFFYDQQSSTDETPWGYGGGGSLPSIAPCGQSFTPTLSGVNFVRLNLNDGNPNDGLGTTIHLNLRANSFSGTILGTSDTVAMPNGFTGVENFFFPSIISLTPDTLYFFEVVETPSWVQWNIAAGSYDYYLGDAYYLGRAASGSDLWFREGIYVPEPSALALAALAAATLAYTRRKR